MARALLLFVLCLSAIVPSGRAFAHAVLLETYPANGAVLAARPPGIMLHFSETVSPIAVSLTGRDGTTVLPATAHDTMLHIPLTRDLADGRYIVSYRVVSADSHPIAGAFLFVVGTPSATAPTAPDTRADENAAALLVIANRVALLTCLMFAAGGVLFAAAVSGLAHPLSAALRLPVRIGATVGIASALAGILLQGTLLTGATLLDPAAWRDAVRVGWQSHLGSSMALICFGLLLIIVFFDRARPLGWLAVAGALLAPAALAVSGHAATVSPRWLAGSAMALHGLTVCFWAGSLWPLHRALGRSAAEAVALVRRFSKMAMVAVGLLLASGLTLAILQLDGDITTLITTSYGQLLLLKLCLAALLLALAAFNKTRLTPALTGGDGTAAARMQRSIRLEIAAIGMIVAVTTVLGQTPPPRAAMDFGGGALHGAHAGHGVAAAHAMVAESRGYRTVLTVTPGHVGRNMLTVALSGPDGTPFDALEATVEFSMLQAGIEPLAQPLQRVAVGRYQLTTEALIRPGSWQLNLDVLVNDFEKVTFDVTLPVVAP